MPPIVQAVRALLVVSLALTGGAALAESRSFRAWQANCDAAGACLAETPDLEDAGEGMTLRLARGPDDAAWSLILITGTAAPEQPLDLYATVSGESVGFVGAGAAALGAAAPGAEGALHLLGAPAQRLFDLMGPGSEASFEYLDAEGSLHAPRFSLAGLNAALLWIDEAQGRVGAPRVAGEPPSGLAATAGGADLPAALLTLHAAQEDCEPEDVEAHASLASALELEPGRTLYLLPCYASAYNMAFAAYQEAGGRYLRTYFADYSDAGSWGVTGVLVNPEWDDAAKLLVTLDKWRGIADCGSRGEWRYRDGQLRLERFFHKSACDATNDPADFPLVYEAKPL